MPHIEGVALKRLILKGIDQIRASGSPGSPEQLSSLLNRAGQILARYHVFKAVSPGQFGEAVVAQASHEMANSATSMGVPTWRGFGRHFRSQDLVQAFQDFGPYNILVQKDLTMALIDPPQAILIAPVHKDIAYFLFELDCSFRNNAPFWGPAANKWNRALSESFLAGYGSVGQLEMDCPSTRCGIGLFYTSRALSRLKKHLRRREIGASTRLAAVALKHHASLMRSCPKRWH
jgi:hypothetical protein